MMKSEFYGVLGRRLENLNLLGVAEDDKNQVLWKLPGAFQPDGHVDASYQFQKPPALGN